MQVSASTMKSDFEGMAAQLNRCALRFGLGLSLLAGMSTRVMSAEAGAPPSFEPFQIIVERNIFSATPSRQAAEPQKLPQPSPERLILFGTMSYERGQFAFFDGSNPDFRKDLKLGEQIGGCVLTEIAATQVKLKAGEREWELPVGTCLLRENAGPWKPGGTVDEVSPPSKAAAPTVQSPNSPAPGKAAREEVAFEAKTDENAKWSKKKIGKYLDEMSLEIKLEKHARKMLDNPSEQAPRKPEKQNKRGY